LLVAPLVTLLVSNADVFLLGAKNGTLRDELRMVLFTTVPLTFLACGLTMWILLRLRREIDRRAASEEDLRLALLARGEALLNLGRSLDREQRLRRELDHRVRNNLSSLLGLFGLYENSRVEPGAMLDALRAKVAVLCDVYRLIAATPEQGVELRELLSTILEGTLSTARAKSLVLDGPPVRLPPREANAIAMIAQELVTNSAKHGALSLDGGDISVTWAVEESECSARLVLRWLERPVRDARTDGVRHEGIGLRLIEGFASTDLRGGVTFLHDEGRWLVVLTANLLATKSPAIESALVQEACS